MRRARRAALLGVALVLLALYRATAPPGGLTPHHGGADGGELALVAYHLGVAHPPGYTLYTLTGAVFMRLPLAPTPAQRLQIASHVAGVLAVVAVGILIARHPYTQNHPSAALFAAGALGMSRTFWSQAIIIEVYALLALLFALTWLTAKFAHTRCQATVGGVLFGLALSHHLTALLWLPGLVVLWGRRRIVWRGAGAMAGYALGVMPLLLLAGNPAANWGRVTDSPTHFVAHITASTYQAYLQPPTGAALLTGFSDWAAQMLQDFTLPVLALAVVGLMLTARRDLRAALVYALWTVPLVAFTALYAADDTRAVYTLPLAVVIAVLAGHGLRSIPPIPVVALRWGVGVLLLAWMLVSHYPGVNLRDDTAAQDLAADLLGNAPPDAVVFTYTDFETFTLWYAQLVAGQRGDVVIIDGRMLVHGWYLPNVHALYGVACQGARTPAQVMRSGCLGGRTVVATQSFLPPPGWTLTPSGAWYIYAE